MQAYPGRDPLVEVLSGEMTMRRFRVMVEHLPPGNALERARNGRWSDSELLLWNIEARLRDLFGLTFNIHRDPDKAAAIEPDYLDRPLSDEEREEREQQKAADEIAQGELASLRRRLFSNN